MVSGASGIALALHSMITEVDLPTSLPVDHGIEMPWRAAR
jgi:hypothetical protein